MKRLVIFILLSFSCGNALSLGQTGHRITGQIAESYLTEKTKIELSKIVGNESLAEASSYVDEMRSNPDKFWQKTANYYHYVTVPKGKAFDDRDSPTHKDAVFAIQKYSNIVRDSESSKKDKVLAIKFIIHLIADLHQPLHVGNGTDRGGNDLKLKFFGRNTNLHRIWDTDMLAQKQLSYTEWANWLNRQITKQDVAEWSQTDPLVWINESIAIRGTIYPIKTELGFGYMYHNLPTLKLRLKQAGVRIAVYLNYLFQDVK